MEADNTTDMDNNSTVFTSTKFNRSSTPEAKITSLPRGNPSVTPRSFNRFFAPRQDGALRRDQDALRELPSSGVNSRGQPTQTSQNSVNSRGQPTRTSQNSVPSVTVPAATRTLVRARGLTDEGPTPKKRQRVCDNPYCSECASIESDTNYWDTSDEESEPIQLGPVRRSRFRSALGDSLRRELNIMAEPHLNATSSVNGYSDTSFFYSKPKDAYITGVIPFSSTPCNTNSLVAMGDETGLVRLLETDGNQNFSQPLLSFKAHDHAITDLQFSSDDRKLATASSDRVCQVFDIMTQKPLFSMNGHLESIKNVRFQPGTGDFVLATCGREGTVQIWDTRCHTTFGEQPQVVENQVTTTRPLRYVDRQNFIDVAHWNEPPPVVSPLTRGKYIDRRTLMSMVRPEVSATSISFLSLGNPHIILSSASVDATVKVWDMRMHQNRNREMIPLSRTAPPNHHLRYRHFGVTSMVVSADSSRVYTLCKDSTVYVYSSAHLMLGGNKNLYDPDIRADRNPDRRGAEPIYGFRHPKAKITSFYLKMALRPPRDDKPEMIAIGSTECCSVIFPTDERTFPKQPEAAPGLPEPFTNIDDQQIPIHNHGTALVHAHGKDVTNMSWTNEGNLVTFSDDTMARVWRSEGNRAMVLRLVGDQEGIGWGHGWAEMHDGYDEYD